MITMRLWYCLMEQNPHPSPHRKQVLVVVVKSLKPRMNGSFNLVSLYVLCWY